MGYPSRRGAFLTPMTRRDVRDLIHLTILVPLLWLSSMQIQERTILGISGLVVCTYGGRWLRERIEAYLLRGAEPSRTVQQSMAAEEKRPDNVV